MRNAALGFVAGLLGVSLIVFVPFGGVLVVVALFLLTTLGEENA